MGQREAPLWSKLQSGEHFHSFFLSWGAHLCEKHLLIVSRVWFSDQPWEGIPEKGSTILISLNAKHASWEIARSLCGRRCLFRLHDSSLLHAWPGSKQVSQGWQLRCHLGSLQPTKCLVRVLSPIFPLKLPDNVHPGDSRWWLEYMGLCHPYRSLIFGFWLWLWLGPVLDIIDIWGVNQQMEKSLPPTVCVPFK